ncbi:MAG: ABC transporter permease [Bacteroidales bacterium]|nr:ABC transporter permease [Bacteroidales bacterium]
MYKSRYSTFYLILIFLGGLLLLFLVAPLLGMFFKTSGTDLWATANEKEVTDSFLLTIFTALGATVTGAILAIPLSYILARKDFPLKGLVSGIIDLPVVIPHSAAGIAILGFISRDTTLGKAAEFAGITLVGSPIAISMAMAFVSLPFLVNAARDGFAAVPERLEKAAMNLGASPTKVFLTISLPLAWRSILSGLIMMFARGMSEFGAVIIVAYHPMVAPVMIFERFSSFGLKYATPVSVLFILVALFLFIAFRLLLKKKKNA